MSYILGTAGHVDHGKTLLISKLTGINTTHLPEEKRRGMTIELGFASLQDEKLGTVGIVDVPGHERFIRNMVSGTWGLDAALLVIAADDGWMQMTGDHLRVLKAMKVTSVLVVINKIDLVDREMLDLLREEIEINCIKILGSSLDIVEVSSLTGQGIETLKAKITELLANSKKQTVNHPFLYVDRVFTLKGIGVTVTGTLRGSSLLQGDNLFLYPGNIACRVKNIQSHHRDVAEIEAGSRTALNLKVSDKVEIKRGMLLARPETEPILQGRELLVRIDEFFYSEGQINTFKNHTELEIALGSTHAIGTLHLNSFDHSLARLSLNEVVAANWNENACLIRHGGSNILAACRVLAIFDKYNKATFKKAFEIYTNRELSSWQAYEFELLGYSEKSKLKTKTLPLENKKLIETETFYFSLENFGNWQKTIIGLGKKTQVGFTIEEIDLPLPTTVKEEILKFLCKNGELEKVDHRYVLKGKKTDSLSPNAKKILDMAIKAGNQGIEVDKLSIPQAKKEVRDLVLLQKLVLLENFLYYHIDVYKAVEKQILQGKKQGDILTIAETREKTGLSRKYVIPILNLLEKEKKVKRNENDRVVL